MLLRWTDLESRVTALELDDREDEELLELDTELDDELEATTISVIPYRLK